MVAASVVHVENVSVGWTAVDSVEWLDNQSVVKTDPQEAAWMVVTKVAPLG